jgi:diguanylate cyclase (GGDEF)-like protein
MDQIADRLGALVRYDNLSIELWDQELRALRPLTAKGAHAADFMEPWGVGEQGIATWVLDHNEPQLIPDELADPRIRPFDSTGPLAGSMVVVPLRGREGAKGVLTLERLGGEDGFTEGEFELVQLFAAHVSIALQNAEAHSAVEVRARSDGLTGTLNHATFQDRLARAVGAREPFSLVMLDLDDFKSVNDRFGHQAGDRFLREVAAAIGGASRDSDLVFRYGGDEFVLILPATGQDGARAVADRIRAALHDVGAEGSDWHRDDVVASGSLGLATYPDDGGTAEEMLLAADRALFVAKRGGRDRIATAAEGRAIAAEFSLQVPTPVDTTTLHDAHGVL